MPTPTKGWTISEAAREIRATNPAVKDLDDMQVIDQYLTNFPEKRNSIIGLPEAVNPWVPQAPEAPPPTPIPEAPPEQDIPFTWGGTALRTLPPLIAGGAGMAVGGPVGMAVGGGTAATIGEWLAQKYEGRDEINPYEVAVQGAMGAIPFMKTATIPKAIAQGVAHGGVGGMGLHAAQGGELTPEALLAAAGPSALAGGVMSGGAQGLMNRFLKAGGQAGRVGGKLGAEVSPTGTPQQMGLPFDDAAPITMTTRPKPGGQMEVPDSARQRDLFDTPDAPVDTRSPQAMEGYLFDDMRPLPPDMVGPPAPIPFKAGSEFEVPTSATARTPPPKPPVDAGAPPPPSGDVPTGGDPWVDLQYNQRPTLYGAKDIDKRPWLESFVSKYADNKISVRRYISEAQKKFGVSDPLTAADQMDLNIGGIYPKKLLSTEKMNSYLRNMKREGIQEDVTRLVDYDSMNHHIRILEDNELRGLGTSKGIDFTTFEGAFPKGFTAQNIAEGRARLQASMSPERWNRVQQEANFLYDQNRETIDILLKSGRISQEYYDKLTSRGSGYTPLLRFLDANEQKMLKEGMRAGNQKDLTAFNRFVGSTRATRNPFEASIAYRHAALESAGRNESGRAFLNYHKMGSEMSDAFPVVRTEGQEAIPGTLSKTKAELDAQFGENQWASFSTFDNGQEIQIAAPTYVTNAIKLVQPQFADLLGLQALGTVGGMTRRMATAANLAFSLPNVLRDVTDMALLGKVMGKNTGGFMNYAREWFSLLPSQFKRAFTDPRTAVRGRDAFLQSGAGGSTQAIEINPQGFLQLDDLQLTAKSSWDSVKGGADKVLFGWAEKVSNVLEENTKLAAYNTMMGVTKQNEAGRLADMTEEAARAIALEVRRYGGSPDFAVRGEKSRELNAMILFFNAQVQGISRNMKGIKRLATDKSMRTQAGYVLTGILGTELLRNQWNRSFVDSDGTPSMDRVTDNDEEQYFTFIAPWTENVNGVERHAMIKWSKGHAARPLFNPVAAMIRNADRELTDAGPQRGRRDASQIAMDTASQFLPGSFNIRTDKPLAWEVGRGAIASLNPVFKAPIEAAIGRNTFSDIPIVPDRLSNLPPAEQYTSRTGETAKLLGQATGFSPAHIENFQRGAFPGPGEVVAGVSDAAISAFKGDTSPAELPFKVGEELIDPIARRFRASTGDQIDRDQQSIFYEMTEKAKGAQALVQRTLRESGGDQAAVQRVIDENEDLLRMRLPLIRIQNQLGAIRRLPDEQRLPLQRKLLTSAMQIMNPLTEDNLEKFYRNYQERK